LSDRGIPGPERLQSCANPLTNSYGYSHAPSCINANIDHYSYGDGHHHTDEVAYIHTFSNLCAV
jgi:hypothetical protein